MENQEYLPTNQMAPSLGIKPATMIRSLCVNGHYLGMIPIKLPNNRLLWPRAGLDRIFNQAKSCPEPVR